MRLNKNALAMVIAAATRMIQPLFRMMRR